MSMLVKMSMAMRMTWNWGEKESGSGVSSCRDQNPYRRSATEEADSTSEVASSPHFAARRDTTLRRSSIYHPSESIGGNLFQEPYFPMNEQIDLKLPIDGEGDISISAPSRMGFELADGGCLMEQDVPE